MQHVSAAEFAFCLGNGCLRWNDFLWEQSKVEFGAFPPHPMGRGHPAWQREADTPQLPSPQRGRTSGFWQGGPWSPAAKAVREVTGTGDLLIIPALPAAPLPDHLQALHGIALPPWWVSVIPAADTLLVIHNWHQLQQIAGRNEH